MRLHWLALTIALAFMVLGSGFAVRDPFMIEGLDDRQWLSKAQDYSAADEWDQTIFACDHAIAINPYYAEAYALRGDIYKRKGFWQKSLWNYSQAIALEPQAGQFYEHRGLIYYNRGLYKEAIADFTAALVVEPANIELLRLRGEAYARSGLYVQALLDYKQLHYLSPQDPFIYYHKALALEQLNRTSDAMALYLLFLYRVKLEQPNAFLAEVDYARQRLDANNLEWVRLVDEMYMPLRL